MTLFLSSSVIERVPSGVAILTVLSSNTSTAPFVNMVGFPHSSYLVLISLRSESNGISSIRFNDSLNVVSGTPASLAIARRQYSVGSPIPFPSSPSEESLFSTAPYTSCLCNMFCRFNPSGFRHSPPT